jgi:excinuclease ABC subunit C
MFNIQDELLKLPDKSGVYIMKDKNGSIIYVGKAVTLKNRVKQYFHSPSGQTDKVRTMVPLIREFEYIVTDSEIEALILECNLIKKHKPVFNVRLKDDKNYPYIKVTMNEDYPRILMTRRLERDGGKYFGPYTNVGAVKNTIKLVKAMYPVKSCSRKVTRDTRKSRPCLNYHIGQCPGPCAGNIGVEQYRQIMKDICTFLGGCQDDLIRRLENDMKEASLKMNYEKAAKLRDTITGLRQVAERQKVLSTTFEDQDVIAFARERTESCAQVFFIRRGKLTGMESRMLDVTDDMKDGEIMTSFVKQFYSSAAFVPSNIILQVELDEYELITRWLEGKKEAKVYIKVPKRGEKLGLVNMARENASIALNRFREKIRRERDFADEGLKGIVNMLRLEKNPVRIEAYDISNSGTLEKTGSMVVFKDGIPCNREYKRFKIKHVEGQDDYASMQEMIYRRFRHAGKGNNDGDSGFSVLPELILVDGGKGHVSSVKSVLGELDLNISVYGMVKDDRHRRRRA